MPTIYKMIEGNEMNPVEREFKEKMTVNPRITLPMIFWEEWKNDCKERFNDTYFLKMKFEHEFTKNFMAVANLLASDYIALREQFDELKERVQELEQNGMHSEEENRQEKKVKTLDFY